MSVLVRKIERSKWDIDRFEEDVPADAVTVDMKTSGNRLSVWRMDEEDSVDDAVLALAAERERLDTMYVVALSPEYISGHGITSVASPVNNPVEDLVSRHEDLDSLSYKKLGVIAFHIADKIRDKKERRYTVEHQKQILRQALEDGRLQKDNLKESVRGCLDATAVRRQLS